MSRQFDVRRRSRCRGPSWACRGPGPAQPSPGCIRPPFSRLRPRAGLWQRACAGGRMPTAPSPLPPHKTPPPAGFSFMSCRRPGADPARTGKRPSGSARQQSGPDTQSRRLRRQDMGRSGFSPLWHAFALFPEPPDAAGKRSLRSQRREPLRLRRTRKDAESRRSRQAPASGCRPPSFRFRSHLGC